MVPHTNWSHGNSGSDIPEIEPGELTSPDQGPEIRDIRLKRLPAVGEESSDAIRVWIVVPDSTPEELLQFENVEPIREQIREKLRALNPDWVPSFRFRTVEEFEEDTGEQL